MKTQKTMIQSLGVLRIILCAAVMLFIRQSVFTQEIKQTRLPLVAPEDAAMDAKILSQIDAEVQNGLAEKNMPGCVVCVGRHGKIAYLKAFGNKQVETENEPAREMTTDTVFDLASLTKSMATATSIMKLVDQGKLNVDDKFSQYFDEFKTPEKQEITIRQLMTHTAGFIPDNHLRDYQDGTPKAVERLLALKPVSEPGTKFVYSDVSFELLGLLVERVSGKNVADFARENIYEPLGMTETMYVPNDELSKRAAPTQERELGKVHDPRAFLMDGIAGHAGLFSTAEDMAVYATMMLNDAKNSSDTTTLPRILKAETVKLMTTRNRVPGGYRGLGWDMRTGFSSNRGQNMSPSAYGHGGFTGTAMWIDPKFDLFVIFLSNRVHPNGKGNVNPLAGRIGTIAVDAIKDVPTEKNNPVIPPVKAGVKYYQQTFQQKNVSPQTPVLTGLDVLALDDFALFRNKRIGLVTNHTGVTKDGTFITKYLKDAGIELTALFSPEHGFTGEFDKSNVEDSKDANTGLTVYSLYGETRKPSPEMLDNVDILVYDIQDVGVRFYTYTSTMSLAMEAAADKGIPFVVLDRPNPIRGDRVNGPILQAGRETFIAIHKMPVQHGLTIGEIALMIAAERRYDPILQVVPCLGWKREMDYDATKLKWINPSPNMRNLTEAYFYPGLGLLEFTNISVGRGTETPFEHFGAPWIFQGNVVADGRQEAGGFISDISPNLESPPSSSGLLANGTKDSFETKDFLKTKDSLEVFVAALNQSAKQANLRGVRFEPATFTPTTREFQGEKCGGAKMILEDRESFQSVRLGLVIALTLYELYPDAWKTRNLNTLLLHDQTRQLLRNRAAAAEIEKSWQPELQEFLKRRENYLLY